MTAPPRRPVDFDETRLHRLLVLVGPGQAQDLLHQLDADLSTCAATIDQGAAQADWSALREASHNLISLAGSAGADGLLGLARDLNAAAHAQDGAALSRLVPGLALDLAALIAVVRDTPPTAGAAR